MNADGTDRGGGEGAEWSAINVAFVQFMELSRRIVGSQGSCGRNFCCYDTYVHYWMRKSFDCGGFG